tara:strand:- start:567 stop:947 length:381 start_codon:yes stop_codon:yes gene_type:complete
MRNNDLTYCPNIGGAQILMRKIASIFGVIITLFTIFIISYYNLYEYNFIILIISFGTGVTIFETLDKTCIVYAFYKIKNINSKYEKERNDYNIMTQRKKSVSIILKGFFFAITTTLVAYVIQGWWK